MNIFAVIGRTTRRVEPFHSMFLTDALRESLTKDQMLFDSFWNIAVANDPSWPPPAIATVKAEDVIGTMRVDVTIIDEANSRCLGIEVKTEDASAKAGQLGAYQEGLEEKYAGYEVRLAYLTPFNRERTPEEAHRLHSVAEFDSFANNHPEAVHLSWLDVADIDWAGGGEAWSTHQAYVREVICRRRTNELRGLDAFFGPEIVDRFWMAIAASGAPGVAGDIDLVAVDDTIAFVDAFRVLIESPAVNKNRERRDRFPGPLRDPFLDSRYTKIHAAMFSLADEYPWVWTQGGRNYGIRVMHPDYSSGVSICTSLSIERLRVGQER